MNHAIWRTSEAAVIASWPLTRPMLDIGCGDGSFASMLFPHGADVGIDLRFDQLRRARQRGTYQMPVRGSASVLPFRDESFESVLSNCVLEHVWDVNAACHEVGRVLRPGGYFVFTVPTNQFEAYLLIPSILRWFGLNPLARAYTRGLNGHFLHYHVDRPSVWEARCLDAGLAIVDRRFLMPPAATRLWDGLMPIAALQLASRRAGRQRFQAETAALQALYSWLAPMLEHDARIGANIAFLARKAGPDRT